MIIAVMASNAEEEFLKLYKGFMRIGPRVLRRYIDTSIVNKDYHGVYHSFVQKKKHILFHSCTGYKKCCFCGLSSDSLLDDRFATSVFDKLYERLKNYKCLSKNRIPQSNNNNNQISKHSECICKFVPDTTVEINNLDITPLCALILADNKEPDTVLCIRSTRNKLAHHPDIDCPLDYEQVWADIFSSFGSLAKAVSKDYWESIQDHLTDIKGNRLHKEEQQELEQLREEHKKQGEELHETQTCLHGFIELFAKFTQETAECMCCKSHHDALRKDLTAKIESLPDSWNKSTMIENINKNIKADVYKNDDFQIVAAREKCILLFIKASERAFRDKDTFNEALNQLLQRLIEAGNIDSSVHAKIILDIECQHKVMSYRTERVLEIDNRESESSKPEADYSDDEEDELPLMPPRHSLLEIGFLTSIVLDVFPNILREVVLYFSDYKMLRSEVSELDLEQLVTKVFELIKNQNVEYEAIANDVYLMQDIKSKVFQRKSSFVEREEMNKHVENILAIASRFDIILLKTETSFEYETECLQFYWLAYAKQKDARTMEVTTDLPCIEEVELPAGAMEKATLHTDHRNGTETCTTASSFDSGFAVDSTKAVRSRQLSGTATFASSFDSGIHVAVKKKNKWRKKKRKALITDTVTKHSFFTKMSSKSQKVESKDIPKSTEVIDEPFRATKEGDEVQKYINDEDCTTHF